MFGASATFIEPIRIGCRIDAQHRADSFTAAHYPEGKYALEAPVRNPQTETDAGNQQQ
jgi:hypothetical protein